MPAFPISFRRVLCLALALCLSGFTSARAEGLPFDTVFKGRSQFDALVAQADKWKSLPIGERVAAIGRAQTGTRYKSFTLEIDDRIEAPSVNLTGLDCWTFFETSLAFARMLDEPRENWTPQTMLKYIEADRYRGGNCDGTYLSRLHYLEDWLHDNNRRGLVSLRHHLPVDIVRAQENAARKRRRNSRSLESTSRATSTTTRARS